MSWPRLPTENTAGYSAEVSGLAHNLFDHVNAAPVTARAAHRFQYRRLQQRGENQSKSVAQLQRSSGSATDANSNVARSSRQVEIGFRFLF